ncbi:MAG: hypothetical protein ACN6O3_12490 [Comamonas sp.]
MRKNVLSLSIAAALGYSTPILIFGETHYVVAPMPPEPPLHFTQYLKKEARYGR